MLAVQILLGGARSQAGWFLFGLGSFFFWIFVWHTDLSGWQFVRFVAWIAIFPVVGLAVVLSSLVTGRLRMRLLRIGLLAHGRLVEKYRSGGMDDEPVYVLTYEYRAGDGILRRTTAERRFPERLGDYPDEALLLYDPGRSEKAVLVNDLPGTVTLDEGGQLAGASFEFVFLPAITVLIYFWLYRLAL